MHTLSEYLQKKDLLMKNIMNERLPLSKTFPLKARFYDYKHFTYPWHFHPEFEIIYFENSSGTRFVGSSFEPFKAGEILLLGYSLPHCMKSDERYYQENELRAKGIILQFEQDFMYHALHHYPHFYKIRKLLDDSQHGVFFPAECSEKLVQLLAQMPLQSGMEQIILFLELLKTMSEMSSRKILSTAEFSNELIPGSSRVDKVISFINKNYTRKIDLNEIASLAAMNPTAFCRFFKSSTGKSFVSYLMELRINYACKLLLMNTKSISEISIESGFDTISHFNKSFKKSMGLTPSQYQQNMIR